MVVLKWLLLSCIGDHSSPVAIVTIVMSRMGSIGCRIIWFPWIFLYNGCWFCYFCREFYLFNNIVITMASDLASNMPM